jgi:uncharacterized membrane protein
MQVKHKLFLRWWLLVTLIAGGCYYLYGQDFFNILWDSDFTKLSFIIIGLFSGMSLWCGKVTWWLSGYSDHKMYDSATVSRAEHDVETGLFVSDLFFTIGMIGTVIGFIVMLSGFESVDLSNPDTSRELMKTLGYGMSTALYTTLTGLVCSSLLKLQYFNLSRQIEKNK